MQIVWVNRKSVQLNALARNFAENMAQEVPPVEFGSTFNYNKVYFSCLNSEFVTIEKFIEGTFAKWVNNTGGCVDTEESTEVSLKAETFVHYTYILVQNIGTLSPCNSRIFL